MCVHFTSTPTIIGEYLHVWQLLRYSQHRLNWNFKSRANMRTEHYIHYTFGLMLIMCLMLNNKNAIRNYIRKDRSVRSQMKIALCYFSISLLYMIACFEHATWFRFLIFYSKFSLHRVLIKQAASDDATKKPNQFCSTRSILGLQYLRFCLTSQWIGKYSKPN